MPELEYESLGHLLRRSVLQGLAKQSVYFTDGTLEFFQNGLWLHWSIERAAVLALSNEICSPAAEMFYTDVVTVW